MSLDDDVCYRALTARDARFDGRFFVGVLTTGIYCRPICPARTPHRRNVRFYRSAAAAAASGLRACRRCRPDSLPGSREWDHRSDLVARALRLIGSGAADEEGIRALSRRLHVTDRHLNRALVSELGTTAGQLARTRRAQMARLLLEHTDLRLADVAYAAGFRTVRQFNDVIKEQFDATPSQLRRSPASDDRIARPVTDVTVRLQFRPPYATTPVLAWLGRHAVPGVDDVDVTSRTIRTTTVDGSLIEARFDERSVMVDIGLPPGADIRGVPTRISAIRRWLDLDASPAQIDDQLSRHGQLGETVRARPGMRVIGALDPFRSVVSTVVSQQVSVKAAATQNARLASYVGDGTRFPSPAVLSATDPDALAQALGLPKARARTLTAIATEVAEGRIVLGPHADRGATLAALAAIKGVGPWTLADVRMRALGDPDVWPQGDLILRRAIAPGGRFSGLDPADVSPWRSYLAHHVWVAATDPVPGRVDLDEAGASSQGPAGSPYVVSSPTGEGPVPTKEAS